MNLPLNNIIKLVNLPETAQRQWANDVQVHLDLDRLLCEMTCKKRQAADVCHWLFSQLGYTFATMVVEETSSEWLLRYIFYGTPGSGQVHVRFPLTKPEVRVPSISRFVHAADWHERETEDLFGLTFEGHPRLGDFVLHEQWPEGINPMRLGFDSSVPLARREIGSELRPQGIVQAPGTFMMPIGPVYSDAAESAHFLLETVGEDVIRTIPRFFYKYRGVEKIAEGRSVDRALLLSERFSGTSAFAHSLAFCQAVEDIARIEIPQRAKALRVFFAELERFRHHVGAIAAICGSTALAVATSQAGILEEEALRLTAAITGHRYLFGLNIPGGLSRDFSDPRLQSLSDSVQGLLERLCELKAMLRFSSSFLDRLEEVGIVSREHAFDYGLVGPIARASGIARDIRKVLPYSDYERYAFKIPCEQEGDGYARLRVLFSEAEQSTDILKQVVSSLPGGPVAAQSYELCPGSSLGWVEAPRGAAFHWIRIGEDGKLARYRLTTPSFTNWHGFHLAAEDFAFQDFPIIMATFGLSNAESDR
jgi:formate hydrogenlyase subunit 5